ncbi:MAG TPA: HlyD family efflux transporter periplasmic adaptor subunit [Candidatus Polarisedimenticolaceae bacterium]|nr:HlyD family efflux transporter periplasmic adaptor subunit [Candidatus Polarisedimenticolaceae bacterium]
MRRSLGLPLILVCAVFAFPACGGRRTSDRVIASGHIEATDVRIVAKVRGRLLQRPVDEGDAVTPGQTVAVLDTVDVALALREAEAQRDQADAQFRLRLAGSRPEDVAELRARAESARAELDAAEKELTRQERLVAEGVTTLQTRDDALARRDALAAALEAAGQALERAKAGNRAQEIQAAKAARDATEARIAQLRQQLADATVVSPVAGVVTQKLAEPGELLAAGAPILVVTDLSKPWLVVYVAEPDLGRIRLGSEAQVVTDAGEARTGKVIFVASQAEFTPKNVQTRDERVKLVYRVKVGLESADGLFKPGMPAEARF